MSIEQNVNKILDDLTTLEINATNIITTTISIMQYAQNMITEKRNGSKKKELVLLVLQKLIEKIEDESIKIELNNLLATCVPETIDMVVIVASGKLDLGKLRKKYLSCCF